MPGFETRELAVGLLTARRGIRSEFSVDLLDRRYEQHDDNSFGIAGNTGLIDAAHDNYGHAHHHPVYRHIACAGQA